MSTMRAAVAFGLMFGAAVEAAVAAKSAERLPSAEAGATGKGRTCGPEDIFAAKPVTPCA